MQSNNNSSRTFRSHKKSVTFDEGLIRSKVQESSGLESINDQSQNQNTRSHFYRKKLFSVESCKFMSMKNINADGSTQQSSSYNPIARLKENINKMEDVLAKTERSYIRKIKFLGQKFNKECEKQILLLEQIMELKNELKKNKNAIKQIKQVIGKQNINQCSPNHSNRRGKLSTSKSKFRPHLKSPLKFHKVRELQ